MVEQEQDNIDDLRLLLERAGRIEQRRRMP
jgi:hypothetical protein